MRTDLAKTDVLSSKDDYNQDYNTMDLELTGQFQDRLLDELVDKTMASADLFSAGKHR